MRAALIYVPSGRIDPSPVFDLTLGLEHIPDGYKVMDQRSAIKVLVDAR